MKRLVVQQPNQGFESLIGEIVTLFCARFIYTGKLVGISDDFVLLEDPSIVYETGPFDKKEWADVQKLPKKEWYVMLSAVESFGIMK